MGGLLHSTCGYPELDAVTWLRLVSLLDLVYFSRVISCLIVKHGIKVHYTEGEGAAIIPYHNSHSICHNWNPFHVSD